MPEGRGLDDEQRSWCSWTGKDPQGQAQVSHHKSTVEANLSLFIFRLVEAEKLESTSEGRMESAK